MPSEWAAIYKSLLCYARSEAALVAFGQQIGLFASGKLKREFLKALMGSVFYLATKMSGH